MSKHTPGPWEWGGDDDEALRNPALYQQWVASGYATERLTGTVLHGRWHNDGTAGIDVTKADARLIAAAPELLEACKRAIPTLIQAGVIEGAGGTIEWLRRAIQKAEGQS